jgi:7-cyano-7-deazaguanine synthase
MVVKPFTEGQAIAVLFSGGLDSTVLLAKSAQDAIAQPIYVSAGLAWEPQELVTIERLLSAPVMARNIRPVVRLNLDMQDIYPATHWAIRGEAPGFDTPDEQVYLEGRNVVLLAKTAVFMTRAGLSRVHIGPLAGNPFPDASAEFFTAMERALSLGLAAPFSIDAPLSGMHKAEVVRLGLSLNVPLDLTLSCMQPADGLHCGRCSKCRERRDAFIEAGVDDPTGYATRPPR